VTTITTLHVGQDVAYLTAGQHAGGCAGAMSYYTLAGEPPGQWAGKGAAALGLSGQVDPAVIGRLYQHNIGPSGELLVTPRQSPAAGGREQAAVAAYLAAHPYATATELAEARAAGRGTDPHQVPYFDMTVMDLFSSRARSLTPELKALIGQYQSMHGRPPSKRTIWLLGQQAAQNTRRTKGEARRTVAGRTGTTEPTAAQRLAAWEAQTARREAHPCRRCTRRSPSTPGVHRRRWTMRPSTGQRGSPSPRCNSTTRCGRWLSSGSRCTGRCPCSDQAPTRTR
jgi:TrwC relaxase